MFPQQLKHQDVVLPCGTARLEMQVASLVPGWLLAVRSRLHHLLQRYTESTGTLVSFCSLLDDGKGKALKTNAKQIHQGDLQGMQCCRAPQGLFWDRLQGCSCFSNMEGWQAGRPHNSSLHPQALSRHS